MVQLNLDTSVFFWNSAACYSTTTIDIYRIGTTTRSPVPLLIDTITSKYILSATVLKVPE